MQFNQLENKDLYTDKELFLRIAEGEGQAFARIFEKYFERLHWRAFQLLKSGFGADEVVQEVFIQLWEGKDKLKIVDNPAAYLFRMTYNRCFDRIRRQEAESKAQYLLHQITDAGSHTSPVSGYDYQLLEKLIKEAVDSLPAQGRTIYLLQQQESLSYQEIAERLAISKNTVRNHMVKNLHHIRAFLQQKADILFLLYFLFHFFSK